MSYQRNKELVRALVDAVNRRDDEAAARVATGTFAVVARRWVRPFEGAFPDFQMRLVATIAEGDTVVGHFKCSGTHEGEWLGIPPTGRRFADVDEVYLFRIEGGKIVSALGVEDNLSRLRQLGLTVAPSAGS